jgi:hypothetical protein
MLNDATDGHKREGASAGLQHENRMDNLAA